MEQAPSLCLAVSACAIAPSPKTEQRSLEEIPDDTLADVMACLATLLVGVGVGVAAAAAAEGVAWSCGGVRLERVEQYKYLGVTFSAAAGGGLVLAQCATAAAALLREALAKGPEWGGRGSV
ncbi:hypothetical protein WJX81_001910 [Elliptochloris bilobata]|uniref:CASP-like protein n=1 Tax=Elliptochloris bilobata TaxID=381761 RepID=A0AAW1QX70_9CHLO